MTQTETRSAFDELRSLPNWVVWKREMRDGDITKVPYNPCTNKKAKSNDPETWASYERALETYTRSKRVYAGIGFMFSHSPYFGADFDHCRDEHGVIDQWAQEIIDLLASYAELSPSETGIHVFGRGEMPEVINTKTGESKHPGMKCGVKEQRDAKAAIEMYSEGRFFTWSGKHLEGTPDTINNAQETLITIHQHFTAPPQKEKASRRPRGEQTQERMLLTDEKIIAKAQAARNGATFNDLWNGGLSGHLSASEADLAFCNLLAFWCQKDAVTMDRIFRRSGLYRDKWDEKHGTKTYGEMTIDMAIDSCTETYTGYATLKTKPGATNGHNGSNGHEEENSATSGKATLPEIVIGTQQLRDFTKEALAAIKQKHEQEPNLFIHMSTMAKIAVDEEDKTIIMPLGVASLRNELSKAADFFTPRKLPNDMVEYKPIIPPKELAEQILALEPAAWPLLPLKAIVEAPVLRPDGSILDQPGYDADTRLYYVPSKGMEHCKIPNNPTQSDAIAAMQFLSPIFADFPWEGPPDRANAIGLLLTPFVRYAVKKDIQMALIDATNAGTGKGLLAAITSIAATGRLTPPMAAKRDDDEWRKSILTELLQGPRIVIIDNIRGVLESATLELMLTGVGFNERILGQSKSAKPKNEATWMATGNNLLIGGDLARRCYRIRLVSPTATPEERTDFSIPDLENWMCDNRSSVVTALLTIARAWYVAGKPKAKNLASVGTFDDWSKTIGGMLEYVGVAGWQDNRDNLRSRNNEEAHEWEAFLATWHEIYGTNWKSARDVVVENMTEKNGFDFQPSANALTNALPQYLQKALAKDPRTLHVTLAIQLGKRVQTVYGTDGYRIEKQWDTHQKSNVWRVVRIVADGSSSKPMEKTKTKNDADHCTDDTTHYSPGDTVKEHPQPSATSANSVEYTSGEVVGDGFASQSAAHDDGTAVADGCNKSADGCEKSLTPENAVNYPYDAMGEISGPAPARSCMQCQHTKWLPWYDSKNGDWLYQCGECYPALRSSRGRDKFFVKEQVRV